jgi:hypothetical protein
MPATYEPIATATSSGSTSTFSFTSVPSTYTDLMLVCSLRSSFAIADHDTLIRVNGNSSSIYSRTKLEGNGSSASTSVNSNQSGFYSGQVQGASSTSGVFSTQIIQINSYSNTSTFKTFLSRNNTPTNYVSAIVGLWRNTSAINQVDILNADGSNWISGSTATLYGIKAA